MLDNKDPFGFPLSTYAWVIGIGVLGGAVKYINGTDKFRAIVLARDLLTAGFTGLLTFWVCEWTNIGGPLSAVLIATSGLMGTRALKELENLYRLRLGLPLETKAKEESVTVDHQQQPASVPPVAPVSTNLEADRKGD